MKLVKPLSELQKLPFTALTFVGSWFFRLKKRLWVENHNAMKPIMTLMANGSRYRKLSVPATMPTMAPGMMIFRFGPCQLLR